jgi:hypothetical protein
MKKLIKISLDDIALFAAFKGGGDSRKPENPLTS